MLCPHCYVHFHDNWSRYEVFRNGIPLTGWYYQTAQCSECGGMIFEIEPREARLNETTRVYPSTGDRRPAPSQVPSDIAEIHRQACITLPVSPMASAALSRRCLQAVLNDHGYAGRDLAKQVEMVLAETDPRRALPTSLHDTIDSIRNFGNFSAHPINDLSTLQVIDVEPHEADWCLEILDELFDHCYVRPAFTRERKAALDAKLKAAGKPTAKGAA